MDKSVDNLDKKILNIIMGNARIPSKDVAMVCGVSRAAIHQRIQRLIDMKVITGSGYQVNPRTLGYNTCTYIGIRLEKGSMYREVESELQKIPEVVECHYTTGPYVGGGGLVKSLPPPGPYSLLTKVYARDNQHLMELLSTQIQHIPGVTETETLISLEQSLNRQIKVKVDPSEPRRRKS